MNKIIIITGLTASGKSGLALEVAKKYNGEIISADSVQVYRGLDIGSAKESLDNRDKIKHHLIDIKDFDEKYNVGEFLSDCKIAIDDIISRNKLPIIVGGTGLYIKALIEGYSLGGSTQNEDFRANLMGLAKNKGNMYVWEHLNKVNPEKAKTVHYNNLKRVIRYLEIEKYGDDKQNQPSILSDYDVCCLGIIADRESIYKRIESRVDDMIQSGLELEIKSLINAGAKREHQSMNSIGYKEWFDFFEGKVDREMTISLIKQHTRNYCKRQLTFLKTIPQLTLCDIQTARKIINGFFS